MNNTTHRPHRRTVLKGAAWSAPVIVMAAAAPAMAATGPASLSVSGAATVRNNGNIRITSTITNANTQASTSLTVTTVITLDDPAMFGPSPSIVNSVGYTPTAVSGSGATRTVTFSAVAQIGGNSTKAFNVTIDPDSATAATGTVTITANPGAGTGGTSGAITITP